MLRYLTSIITTLIVVLTAFSFNAGTIFADDFGAQNASSTQSIQSEETGSITVCKIVKDQDGVISDGITHHGSFSFSEVAPASLYLNTLPETHFATPLVQNTDIVGDDEVNDSACVTYENLAIGTYFYGNESIEGDGWAKPLYNDQYTSNVDSLDNFYSYSDEIFNSDANDDDNRNKNSDGIIKLTEERPNRTLVVLNTFIKDTPQIVAPQQTAPSSYVENNAEQGQTTTSNECFADMYARIVITKVTNVDDDPADMTNHIYLGQGDSWMPSGTWFPVYRDGAYVTDPDINGYENVPGLAVERHEGKIRVRMYGSHPNDGTLEHVEGYIEFSNGQISDIKNDDNPTQNKMENWGPNMRNEKEVNPEKDAAWIENGKSFFWMTVTTADDSYFTAYAKKPASCSVNHAPVITLIGNATTTITVGDTFTDPGATANDEEDGDITSDILVTGTVTAGTAGTYTLHYNVEDSQGLSAEEKTRTVVVLPVGVCTEPIDVMIVLDRSGSMSDLYPQQPLTNAKSAAIAFVETLNTTTDHVGLVSFSTDATLDYGLSGNFNEVKSAIGFMNADGWTNTGDAIKEAHAEIMSHGRDNTKKVIILLSDGNANRPDDWNGPIYAESEAQKAKADGITIYSIGLGGDINAQNLQQISSGPDFYFFSPTGDQLKNIYLTIAKIECEREPSTVGGMVIDDANKNGVKDAGEPGLGGRAVTLKDINGVLSDRNATTTAQGEYLFNDVISGTYQVCAATLGGWTPTIPATTTPCYNNVIVADESDTTLLFGFFHDPMNQLPVANAGPDKTSKVGVLVTFDGSGSTDSDGTIVLYEWTFGDGSTTTSAIATTTHIYTATSTYTVSLVVKDNNGATSTPDTASVIVTEKPQCSDGKDNDGDGKIDYPADPGCTSGDDNDERDVHVNQPPVADAGSYSTSTVGVSVTFDGSGSTDSDGTIVLYEWTFGDGSTTTSAIATTTHAYTATSTYTVTLKVTDNENATSTDTAIIIIVEKPECSDGKDNDGDGKIDSADPACHTDGNPEHPETYTPSKNTENSAPVITLLGANPINVTVGNTFTDPGATAQDEEDGNITSKIVVTGTVSTGTAGTYTLHYNVKDSKELPAEEKTRTVTVSNGGGGGGGGGGGCSGNCGGGGGGGAVLLPPSLRIYNETIEKTPIPGIVLVRWQTNIPADSRVVYGTASVPVLGVASANYGYQRGTIVVTELVTTHVMAVTGINPQGQHYFRPVSKQGSMSATGIELTLAPSECYYLREFIKFGANNNPEEVKKLQAFLNSFEGSNLPVSGFYDLSTFNVLSAFQNKYKTDVIDPWGRTTTGYVYLTTRKKVNEIYCRAAFPLDQNQSAEVEAFRKLMESLSIHGIVPPGTAFGTNIGGNENGTGLVLGTTTPTESGVENGTASTGSEGLTPTPVTGRSAFRNMLGAVYGAISNAAASHWLVGIFAALVIIAGILLKKFYEKEEEAEEEGKV